jgi:hypothetical protein
MFFALQCQDIGSKTRTIAIALLIVMAGKGSMAIGGKEGEVGGATEDGWCIVLIQGLFGHMELCLAASMSHLLKSRDCSCPPIILQINPQLTTMSFSEIRVCPLINAK